MSRMNPQEAQVLQDNKFNLYCSVLGVKEQCCLAPDKKVIEKAFRKNALKCHPDKGGDPIVFKKLNEAYNKLIGHIAKLEQQAEAIELANSILIEISKTSVPKWQEKLKTRYGWFKTDNCKNILFDGPYKQYMGRSKFTGNITVVLYEDPPDQIPKIHVRSNKYMAWISEQQMPVHMHVDKGKTIQFDQWRIAHLAEFGICNFADATPATPAPERKEPPKPKPKTPKAKRREAREASERRAKARRDSEPTPEPGDAATENENDKENKQPEPNNETKMEEDEYIPKCQPREEKPFNCGHCGEGFNNLMDYALHKKVCVPDEDFGFPSGMQDVINNQYRNDKKSSADEKVTSQRDSNTGNSQKASKQEEKTPKISPEFKCDICNERFTNMVWYTKHKGSCQVKESTTTSTSSSMSESADPKSSNNIPSPANGFHEPTVQASTAKHSTESAVKVEITSSNVKKNSHSEVTTPKPEASMKTSNTSSEHPIDKIVKEMSHNKIDETKIDAKVSGKDIKIADSSKDGVEKQEQQVKDTNTKNTSNEKDKEQLMDIEEVGEPVKEARETNIDDGSKKKTQQKDKSIKGSQPSKVSKSKKTMNKEVDEAETKKKMEAKNTVEEMDVDDCIVSDKKVRDKSQKYSSSNVSKLVPPTPATDMELEKNQEYSQPQMKKQVKLLPNGETDVPDKKSKPVVKFNLDIGTSSESDAIINGKLENDANIMSKVIEKDALKSKLPSVSDKQAIKFTNVTFNNTNDAENENVVEISANKVSKAPLKGIMKKTSQTKESHTNNETSDIANLQKTRELGNKKVKEKLENKMTKVSKEKPNDLKLEDVNNEIYTTEKQEEKLVKRENTNGDKEYQRSNTLVFTSTMKEEEKIDTSTSQKERTNSKPNSNNKHKNYISQSSTQNNEPMNVTDNDVNIKIYTPEKKEEIIVKEENKNGNLRDQHLSTSVFTPIKKEGQKSDTSTSNKEDTTNKPNSNYKDNNSLTSSSTLNKEPLDSTSIQKDTSSNKSTTFQMVPKTSNKGQSSTMQNKEKSSVEKSNDMSLQNGTEHKIPAAKEPQSEKVVNSCAEKIYKQKEADSLPRKEEKSTYDTQITKIEEQKHTKPLTQTEIKHAQQCFVINQPLSPTPDRKNSEQNVPLTNGNPLKSEFTYRLVPDKNKSVKTSKVDSLRKKTDLPKDRFEESRKKDEDIILTSKIFAPHNKSDMKQDLERMDKEHEVKMQNIVEREIVRDKLTNIKPNERKVILPIETRKPIEKKNRSQETRKASHIQNSVSPQRQTKAYEGTIAKTELDKDLANLEQRHASKMQKIAETDNYVSSVKRMDLSNTEVNINRPSVLGPSRFDHPSGNPQGLNKMVAPKRNETANSVKSSTYNSTNDTMNSSKSQSNTPYQIAKSQTTALDFGYRSPELSRRKLDKNFNASPKPFSFSRTDDQIQLVDQSKSSLNSLKTELTNTVPKSINDRNSIENKSTLHNLYGINENRYPQLKSLSSSKSSSSLAFEKHTLSHDSKSNSSYDSSKRNSTTLSSLPSTSVPSLAALPKPSSYSSNSTSNLSASSFSHTSAASSVNFAQTSNYNNRAKSEGSTLSGSLSTSLANSFSVSNVSSSLSSDLLSKIQATKDKHKSDIKSAMNFDKSTWKPPVIKQKYDRPDPTPVKYSMTLGREKMTRMQERECTVIDRIMTDRQSRGKSDEFVKSSSYRL